MQTQERKRVETQNQFSPPPVDSRNRRVSTIIDGCTVTITSTEKGMIEPLLTAKKILLSAYRGKPERF